MFGVGLIHKKLFCTRKSRLRPYNGRSDYRTVPTGGENY